jgi:molybdopterin-guanine dinucleotide biosynthesis protein B
LVSLLGDSGTGKTTLSVGLLARWRSSGLRVGYIKHASHGFDLDRPGKDSARASEAGAEGVVLTGPQGVAFQEQEPDLDPRRLVRRFLADRDVVVLERFRDAALPSVLVVGPRGPAVARAAARGQVLAYVRGAGSPPFASESAATPVFETEDLESLAAHLEARLRLTPHAASALAS